MPRQNSYFHYLKDCRHASPRLCLSSDIVGQEAIYVRAPTPSNLRALPWGALSEVHHSIHLYYRSDASPLAKGMSAMHDTFVYENAVVHVYRNHQGLISMVEPVQVKMHDGSPVFIGDALRQDILWNASLLSGFYEELSREKSNLYLELHEVYTILEQEICSQVDASADVREQIIQLLEMADQLNRYDDANNFKWPVFLALALKQQGCVEAPILKQESEVVLSSDFTVLPEKKKKKKSKKKGLRSEANNQISQIRELLGSMSARNELEVFLLLDQLLKGLDDALTVLNVSFDDNVQYLIDQQKQYHALCEDLLRRFKTQILGGNLDVLEKIYPYMEKNAAVRAFFLSFFAALDHAKSDKKAIKLVSVGRFLYENSQIYRSMIYSDYNLRKDRSLVPCRIDQTTSFVMASLAAFNLPGKFPIFEMLVEQGFSAEEACNSYADIFFNSIEMCLIFFNECPDVRFISKLLDYYPGTTITRKTSRIALDVILASAKIEFRPVDKRSEKYLYLKELSTFTDYFSLACRAAKSSVFYSEEVILMLASRSSLLNVFLETAGFLMLNYFFSRPIFSASDGQPLLLSDRLECDRQQVALEEQGERNDRLCLLFFLNTAMVVPAHIYSIAFVLLREVFSRFSALPHVDQQRIVLALKNNLMTFLANYSGVDKYLQAKKISLAAHLAFSFIVNPDVADDENMLWIFFYRDQIESRLNKNLPSGILLSQAIGFVKTLAPNVRDELQNSTIYHGILRCCPSVMFASHAEEKKGDLPGLAKKKFEA